MKLYGVLLDTMSIQKYIFATNRLKENLGASCIVKDIYKGPLLEALKSVIGNHITEQILNEWEEKPQRMKILQDNMPFEVGYIGGGNAFLLFKKEVEAISFIQRWTLQLLVCAPGILPASAMKEIEVDEHKAAEDPNWAVFLTELFKLLQDNKNRYIPQTIIPRHGITAECPHTGYSAETWYEKLPKEEQKYLSSVSCAKLNSAKMAKIEMENLLNEIEGKVYFLKKYTFPDELEKLGQHPHEDSHIAIVHIDGNDMAKRFMEAKTLKEKRELSYSVREATMNSVKELIKILINEFDNIRNEFNIRTEGEQLILPIRPIIIGGDDITFVTDGRLGIYFATLFMELFEKQRVSDGKPLSACAGVAITKTKYPFYRGYELSEELCKNAKDERKKMGSDKSWLDFHLLRGSLSGNLKELRVMYYTSSGNTLTMRPYSLEEFKNLIKASSCFLTLKNGKPEFPRSKLLKLREVLYMSEASQKAFINELNARQLKLPEFSKDDLKFHNNILFKNKKTPYLDMIECLELYPKYAFKKEVVSGETKN